MKKRMLCILLTLCLALSIMPIGVFADGEKTEKVESKDELINALEDDTVDIIKLNCDIEVNSTLVVDRKVTLDLVGYMLEISGSGSVIKVENGGQLTLKDSDLTSTYYFNPEDDGLWKWGISGTKTVNGGVIYGGTGSRNGDIISGGGVYVDDGGEFTMIGGNIVGCTATIERREALGGGVYVAENGSFTMSGGSITGCTAVAAQLSAYAMGGGICNEGTTTLSGTAEIRECRITHAGNLIGGGIFDSGVLNISGDVKIIGCRAEGLQSEAMYTNIGGTINGGTFDGSVWSHSTITGGTFNGEVINSDTITGGIFKGKVTNGGPISGGMFYGGITEGGVIRGCTVTYLVDSKDYAMQVLPGGTAALKPDEPTKDGYTFIGWYDGDTEYDFTGLVTGKITLTAKWLKIADKTADFTASDGGAEAISLLNTAKIGAADSTWDNVTKTLTLKGVSFATTATTALKLPDGAKVILADGTENHIIGGGATSAQDGEYNNKIYVYGIYAAGALAVQGEKDGTGTLFVNSGEHINSGNAWTYSAAIYSDGDLEVKGGSVTAQGGKVTNADCSFSFGVQLSEGHSLSVSGGTLIGIGGESINAEDPSNIIEYFSEGFDIYNGNVTISGSGKIIGKTIPEMINKDLSYGFRILFGNINVSDSAALTATSTQAICISFGDIKLSGGKLSAFNSSDNISAITISGNSPIIKSGNENIEITGGELECVGGIYMSVYPKAEGKGIFSVTNGKVTTDKIYGPDKLKISGGTVKSGKINADAVELQGGSLTVRESVRKNASSNKLNVSHAIYCEDLTISGGTLDAAWDWGSYTREVLVPDPSEGYPTPLIKTLNGTVKFSGGTVSLDTGFAGNTVLKAETLELLNGVFGTGYSKSGADTYIQNDGSTAVKFTVSPPADYSLVNEAINRANSLNPDDYIDFSAVRAAVNAVVRGKYSTEQSQVNAMAAAIENAISALVYKSADYTAVNEAINKANSLNPDDYIDFSAVRAAVNAVVRGKNITEQSRVNAMAAAIENAISALVYKSADYTAVNEAINRANLLNPDDYIDFSAVRAAVNAVVRGKYSTEQSQVNAMAAAIENAISALVYKSADYTAVNEAINRANLLNPDDYIDFSAVHAAVNAVVRGKNITEQAQVNAMAKAIEDAIAALEKKPAEIKTETGEKSPKTGNITYPALWIAFILIGGGAFTALTVKRKKAH